MESTGFNFCACGRPSPCTSKRCSGKEKKLPIKKIGKYSGYSKWFETNGQNLEEDDNG